MCFIIPKNYFQLVLIKTFSNKCVPSNLNHEIDLKLGFIKLKVRSFITLILIVLNDNRKNISELVVHLPIFDKTATIAIV